MASVPRILTVDPYGNISAQIRAAFELMDRYVTQIDVPNAEVALEEFKRGGIDAVIASWTLGDKMQGWLLAGQLQQIDPTIAVILLGNYGDIEMDDATREQSPYVYLRRPFDIPQLIRVLSAALDHGDIFEAIKTPVLAGVQSISDMGPVPSINVDRARDVLRELIRDLNPISVILSTREGEIVALEGTNMSDFPTEEISHVIMNSILANLDLRDYIGGNASAFQYFDGDVYDIYALSVGLHHFVLVVFEGSAGSRQLGAVSNYGRKRVEGLIGVLGANAWILQRRAPEPEEDKEVMRRSQQRPQTVVEEEPVIELERAQITSEVPTVKVAEEEFVSNLPQMEAISEDEFDLNAIFGGNMEGSMEDMFSLDALGEIVQEEDSKKDAGPTISWDDAEKFGLLGGS